MASNERSCWPREEVAACCCWDPWAAAWPGWSRLACCPWPLVDVAPAAVTLPRVLLVSAHPEVEDLASCNWDEQSSSSTEKNRNEQDQVCSASGNASVTVSTDINTGMVASQELPGDGQVSRWWVSGCWPRNINTSTFPSRSHGRLCAHSRWTCHSDQDRRGTRSTRVQNLGPASGIITTTSASTRNITDTKSKYQF